MYDAVMPERDIEPAIYRFARQRAQGIIRNADAALIECMGGEERIMRMCLRDAARAASALTVSPRVRLERAVAHWSRFLDESTANPDDDDAIVLELEGILRTRLTELDAALSAGDVDGAFRLLRDITIPREGEEQPISVAVPDPLDPESAYWLDLYMNLEN